MKRSLIIVIFTGIFLSGCIVIEDIPIVSVNPAVTITSHIASGKVFSTVTLNSVTTVLVPGNVKLSYQYTGSASIINAANGAQLAYQQIDLEGSTQIFTISADTAGVNDFIIIIQGELEVYAEDKKNTYLTSAPFHGEEQYTFFVEEVPRVSVNPTVTIMSHISGKKLNTTAIVYANPVIQFLGNIPIVYQYEGIVLLIDGATGKHIATAEFPSGGTSQFTTASADIAGIQRFVIIVTGQVVVYADRGNDEDPSNDIYLNSGLFYEEDEVIIIP
ncbi:MAG TPA: hypothetical protein ENN61_01980 [Bacteroidaceae bacterium]|nr:hypothetical protein [Bacteroidaceae bacterium]